MPNFVRRWMPLAIAVSLLTACATANSDPAVSARQSGNMIKEFQRKLADEIEAAPTDAAFPSALQDYAVLRLQVKKCP
jgi:hypothetical protein